MNNIVFNNKIGNPSSVGYPKLTKDDEENIIAGLFEQLLIFDKVSITTNRVNFALAFLISKLGINTVERLFELDYIKILLWTPVIVSGNGRQKEDGTIDQSVIYGQPPIVAGALGDKDLDPEENINNAIAPFNFHRDRRRIFTRRAAKNYIIPNGMEFSTDSAKVVIDAYENNNLSGLGLPFEKESNQLDFEQRQQLLGLGNKVLETAILSKYGYKSFDNYEHVKICQQNLDNIGKAYNVAEGTSSILNLENLPDLKSLFINEKLKFDDIFTLRHLSNAKYYRKWINGIAEDSNAEEITKEYINQIKGTSKFFNSGGGKFVRNVGMFGVGTALGAALAGPVGAAAGFGLGLLDTFVLDGLLIGKNPSMFVDELKNKIENEE
ncbi:hypothetical protein [Plebeiibacterium sediminum]|uniref:Uncharacterized protein n=1 Tax=Plebeiibacterium sediminum TaxID=2992112 RepID=A0AAE3SHS3_9BACT|nr:hypothetical protein [Plebeiobacterium sediminum]MCW3789721.1 hypothetical protein [Plebeiobacterium sediminum]